MLDMIHHVIFIGDWLQEMTAVSAREHVFVRLVNKRRSFSIWDSSLAVATHSRGSARGPWEVTFAAASRVQCRIGRAFLRGLSGLCVWMSVFSPVLEVHKQGDAAGRKL